MGSARDGILCQINGLRKQLGPPEIFRYFAKRRPIYGPFSHILLNGCPSELHLDYFRLLSTSLNSAQNRQDRLTRLQ
jgi:hypothetical protein